jgi:hypothetical protein
VPLSEHDRYEREAATWRKLTSRLEINDATGDIRERRDRPAPPTPDEIVAARFAAKGAAVAALLAAEAAERAALSAKRRAAEDRTRAAHKAALGVRSAHPAKSVVAYADGNTPAATYPSIRRAAAAVGVSNQALYCALARGTLCAGRRWAFAGSGPPKPGCGQRRPARPVRWREGGLAFPSEHRAALWLAGRVPGLVPGSARKRVRASVLSGRPAAPGVTFADAAGRGPSRQAAA